ncbi:MAG: hypothetical protein FJ027_04465 [Candidatus Rokubacteria bacterium]|nr:hypothetical protein [Candidatus Rokubacteria bacterium]
MTTRTETCTCGGPIKPSYIAAAPILGALAAKGEMTYPAACETCGTTYVDVVSVLMTAADLKMVRDRLSQSTHDELMATATEAGPESFTVVIAEARARDLAAKSANLGLASIAKSLRQELDALTLERRAPRLSERE